MNTLWQITDSESSQHWRRKTSQLVMALEKAGYEIQVHDKIDVNGESLSLFLPGLDTFILTGLNSSSSLSPLAEQWLRSARTYLWDRAELRINHLSRTMEYRWIYWSPMQTLIHAAICGLFLLKVWSTPETNLQDFALLLLGCSMMNAVAFFLSRYEESRLKAFFIASGFTR